jgi:hypothetical protein
MAQRSLTEGRKAGQRWKIGSLIAVGKIESELLAVREEPELSLFSNLP